MCLRRGLGANACWHLAATDSRREIRPLVRLVGTGQPRYGWPTSASKRGHAVSSTVRVPCTKVVLLLLGLCRQRELVHADASPDSGSSTGRRLPAIPLEEHEGWLYFRWTGLRGGTGMVGVPADNPGLVAALRRAITNPRAYVELVAILAMAALLGGHQGEWRLERVAELLYGRRRYARGRDRSYDASHRERQLPGIRGWLELLQHAYWQLDTGETAPRKNKGKGHQPVRQLTGSLVQVEQHHHASASLRLHDALAADLRSSAFAVVVPAAYFLLPRKDHHNPHGNTPSLATRARIRLAGAIAARWRAATGQAVSGEELLGTWAALDLGRVADRNRLRAWVDIAQEELTACAALEGPGLATAPTFQRRALRTLFHLGLRPRAASIFVAKPPAPPQRSPARARAPS